MFKKKSERKRKKKGADMLQNPVICEWLAGYFEIVEHGMCVYTFIV